MTLPRAESFHNLFHGPLSALLSFSGHSTVRWLIGPSIVSIGAETDGAVGRALCLEAGFKSPFNQIESHPRESTKNCEVRLREPTYDAIQPT